MLQWSCKFVIRGEELGILMITTDSYEIGQRRIRSRVRVVRCSIMSSSSFETGVGFAGRG